MVVISTVPAATASATTQTILVTLKESLCKAYCTISSIKPVVNVTYTLGTPIIQTSTAGTILAVVPINANGTITYIPKGSCGTITKMFAETFSVGFTDLTSADTSFTITTGALSILQSNVKCCNRAYGVDIDTFLTIAES